MQQDEQHHLKHITHEALQDMVHFDNKIFKTLPVLIFKPGKLTESSFDEKNNDYVKPLALFGFLNFLFFVIKFKGIFAYRLTGYQSQFAGRISNAAAETHLSLPLLTERFNTAMHFEQKEYLVVMVPFFALLVMLLCVMERRHFVQHLVFSLHFYSFFIVFLMVLPYIMLLVRWVTSLLHGQTDFFGTEYFLTGTILIVNFIYLLFAVRRFYGSNWLVSVIKSTLLSYGVLLLIVYVFRLFLFFAVMHTITEI
jgi:hypothetical protein